MKYINAEEVLPQHLLMEIQKHINGELIYIPNTRVSKGWGEKSGSRNYFDERNLKIRMQYHKGNSIEQLAQQYGLAYDTVRKIVYSK